MDINDLKEENVELTEGELFRKQISLMSFEELLKLKDKIGSKQYSDVVFGTINAGPQRSFKRANKNRPRETTSKRRTTLKETITQVRPQAPRDPRFDPLCGTYDDAVFKSNYKFVQNIKKKEREQLAKEYKDEEDSYRKANIKLLMNRMDNQLRESEKSEKMHHQKEEERLSIKKSLMQGEKPVFKKKSVKRVENLISKYEELKKDNKLQKHLEKRHKKLAGKDKKKNNI